MLAEIAAHGRPYDMLDMGCGSGILALRAAQLWQIPIIAADIDAEAVEITRRNAQANGLAEYITTLRSDGYVHPAIQSHGCFALITANVLPEFLISTARDATDILADEGLMLLSGMLRAREAEVQHAYETCGLTLTSRAQYQEWVCLLMQKNA